MAMVRKPKRKKQAAQARSWQMTVLYVISILVVLSMAIGLALSMASKGSSAPLPVSAVLSSVPAFI